MARPKFIARSPIKGNGRTPIRRLLVANRGEIACRIISTCKELGITSIAVYADEDRETLHVKSADEAICLGSIQSPDGNPHLNVKLIIETALSNQADAIHPGYGYLSENSEFARQVLNAGLIFVGPSPRAIAMLGDKRQAKEYLTREVPQIPLVPGYSGKTQEVKYLAAEAEKIGFPVLIKAAAGGGGRGMRIVRDKPSFEGELLSAQSEAQRSFGSSDCLLEKYIERGKHVEIQILGDSSGEVVSLFDRECSIQRRHQKIIEEAPSPWLPSDLRSQMMEAAKDIGRSLDYENAGTVEFVVDVRSAKFYFLEVNTRIQVEHAITEEVTGIDIVALQLFIASGGLLRDHPEVLRPKLTGHSIECRICAEDPVRDFMPDSGLILRWTPGTELLDPRQSSHVRIEAAIQTGSQISTHFDPMIAKIIVWDEDRAGAIARMVKILRNTICTGIKTNILILQAILAHDGFNKTDYTTNFISENLVKLFCNPWTSVPQQWHEKLAFIPSLFARSIAKLVAGQSDYKPFGTIPSGFRNQTYDQSNKMQDVIVVSTPIQYEEEELFYLLVTWSFRRGTPENIYYYKYQVLEPKSKQPSSSPNGDEDLDPGTELARHFNSVFLPLHQARAEIPSEYNRVRIVQSSCHEVQKQSPQPTCWLSASVTLEHNGREEVFQVTTSPQSSSSFSSRDAGRPQCIYVHVPFLGTSIEYDRHTLLSWGESRRPLFRGEGVSDEMRSYKSAMPCKVLRLLKAKGDPVTKGEAMLVIESMKTEVKIVANVDGTFEPVVREGDAVGNDVLLCRVV